MALIDEDRLQGRIMVWSGGRVVLACLGAAVLGLLIGALLF